MATLRVAVVLLVGAVSSLPILDSNSLAQTEASTQDAKGEWVAGTEMSHPEPDSMTDRTVECEGVMGMRKVYINVWPSPGPLPSPSPPLMPFKVFADRNSSSDYINYSNYTNTSDGYVIFQPAEPKNGPECVDNLEFVDADGLVCRDYSMNKELCKVAAHYANYEGQTAVHSCCSCGGGDHVVPTKVAKCVEAVMGYPGQPGVDEAGCDENERNHMVANKDDVMLGHTTLEGDQETVFEHMLPSDDPDAKYDISKVDRILSDVIMEDVIEDDAIDRLQTAEAMDDVMAKDDVVFSTRNFIGYPREPDVERADNVTSWIVEGTLDLDMPYIRTWEEDHGAKVVMALAKAVDVDPASITVTSVLPAVEVAFRIIPEPNNNETVAKNLVNRLQNSLDSNDLSVVLIDQGIPQCEVKYAFGPTATEIFNAGHIDMLAGANHKNYVTETYKVKAKDTMATIAKKFKVPVGLLVSFNPDVADPTLVKEGDVLFIPSPRVIQVHSVEPLESPLEGGADIVVSGAGFVYPAFCKFGDKLSRASYVVADKIVCPTPEQPDVGLFPFAVSDGRGNFREFPFYVRYTTGLLPFCDETGADPLKCRPRLAIFAVSPERWPQDRPTTLYVTGAGFNASSECMVNGEPVHTTVHSRTNVTCALRGMPPSINSVEVRQGYAMATSPQTVVVFSTLVASAIFPRNLDEKGGPVVKITGDNFNKTCTCRFGTTVVQCEPETTKTEAVCAAPPSHSGATAVELAVSNDAMHYSPAPYYFEYTHLSLKTISDNEGHGEGGYVVTITGYGFYPGLYCKFGEQSTPATYISLTEVNCIVPKELDELGATIVPVRISLDGNLWSDDFFWWTYLTEVTEVRPKTGRAIGGEDIHVFGHGFDNKDFHTCWFGDTMVHTVLITSGHIQCFAPPGEGTVNFELRSRAKTYKVDVVGDPLNYTYVSTLDYNVNYLMPDHTSIREKDTMVVVKGVNFNEGSLCRFGDKIAVTTFVDANTLNCVAPQRDLAETVQVHVSNDAGVTFTGLLGMFEYRAVVESLTNPYGPIEGGNEVIVRGRGFNMRNQLCVFGNIIVNATVPNEFEARCKAPPLVVGEIDDRAFGTHRVDFALTSNLSTWYDHYLEFNFDVPGSEEEGTYYVYSPNSDLAVRELQPDAGSLLGQTEVSLIGNAFDINTKCLFGDTTVDPVFVDATKIKCRSPPHVAADVVVRAVDVNGTAGPVTATYAYKPGETDSVDPPSGTISGGTTVTIRGRYLAGAETCTFGVGGTVQVVSGTDTEVTCVTPPTTMMGKVSIDLGFGTAGTGNVGARYVYLPRDVVATPTNVVINTPRQTVEFTGVGFQGSNTFCVFSFGDGAIKANAMIESDTVVKCIAPVRSGVEKLTVTLEVDDTLAHEPIPFTYSPAVADIHPAFGPTYGKRKVVVMGSGFGTVTGCQWGEGDALITEAIVVSDLMVHCVSPPHPVGVESVQVRVANDFVSNPKQYEFKIMDAHVSSIHPTAGSIGGGTMISVRGSGFTVGSYCQFSSANYSTVVVPAIYYSFDHLACPAPPSPKEMVVTVDVSQSPDVTFGFSDDGVQFTYHAGLATVTAISPVYGPEGTEITVYGSGFSGGPQKYCFFGGRQSSLPVIVSDTEMTCVAPVLYHKAEEVVQVSSSSSHLPGGSVQYAYAMPLSTGTSPTVRQVQPSRGPATGGTTVTVSGVNFPSDAQCRFGELYVEATDITSTSVTCVAPSHHPASVSVEVVSAADGNVFSSSFVHYLYEVASDSEFYDEVDSAPAAPPTLTYINPTVLSEGEELHLHGTHFTDPGYCVFADAKDKTIVETVASVPDHAGHCSCVVPARVLGMGYDLKVKFVSLHGLETRTKALTVVTGSG